MAMFQLIRMSSYAKNKLQMFSVIQNSADIAKCVYTLISQTLTFVCYKKWLVLTEKSIHGKVSTQ